MITLMRGPALPAAQAPAVSQTPDRLESHLPAGTSRCTLATGRQTLLHLANRLPAAARRAVLLPAYVAEGVVGPFRAAGIPVHHYRLHADLSPDMNDVSRLLAALGDGGLFVLIHFFGYNCAPAGLVSRLAEAGWLLLEDGAHALYGTTGIGDFSLLSFNKFLPLADGAMLISRRAEIDVGLDEGALPTLPAAALAAYDRHLAANRRLAESSPAGAADALAAIGDSYERYYGTILSHLAPARISPAAAQTLARCPHAATIARRDANAALLGDLLGDGPVRLLPRPLLQAPFCLAGRVEGDRDTLVARALSKGLHLACLVDKWDFVPPGRSGHFAAERDWMAQHVLLPISEFLNETDMRLAAAILKGE